MKLLAVGCGGFLGALARYGLSIFIGTRWRTGFPYATFLINISGSFFLAFFMTITLHKMEINPLWRLFFTTGFLGAYTTFSTLEYETLNLVNDSQFIIAGIYLLGSVLTGFIAVRFGYFFAKLL